MSRPDEAPEARGATDHQVVQASRRAAVARGRFEHELDALLDDLHTLREQTHGHPLPYEHDGQSKRHEDGQ